MTCRVRELSLDIPILTFKLRQCSLCELLLRHTCSTRYRLFSTYPRIKRAIPVFEGAAFSQVIVHEGCDCRFQPDAHFRSQLLVSLIWLEVWRERCGTFYVPLAFGFCPVTSCPVMSCLTAHLFTR